VQSGNTNKIEEVLESRAEKDLSAAPFKIRYDDIKCRAHLYRMAPMMVTIVLLLCYISKFIDTLTSYKDVQKWLNSIMMVLGTLIHSRNKLVDIYGYLVVSLLLILEVALGRNLKTRYKESMVKTMKKRASVVSLKGKLQNVEMIKRMVKEDNDELRDHSKSNVTKFLFKVETIEKNDESEGTRRRSTTLGILESQAKRSLEFSRVNDFNSYEYDPNFLGSMRVEENPVVQKEREEVMVEDQIEELRFDSLKKGDESPIKEEQAVDANFMVLGNKIGKLLYYFANRDLYLNCKMFYGAIYLMFRLAFFILISIGNQIDCIVSLVSLSYLCYYWYSSDDQPMQSVKALNKLAVVIISIKYLIGILDIQRSNYVGDTVPFESSIILMFVGSTDNKNYYYFNCLISNSLHSYWLLYECMIFIAIQFLIFFYTVILQLNTQIINRHITRILFMTIKHIHYNLSVLTNRPFYINFERWFSPRIKYAEMFLKIGTIYLPIIAALSLLAVSQSYATLPIFAIVVLCLMVIYQLIFNWMYEILIQKEIIGKYFSRIRILIWVYILIGSTTRVFERPFKNAYEGFTPLANITFIIVSCLICFQVIVDLWDSKDFERFYTEFLNSNKLSQLVVPLCEAYEFNEKKLLSMISNLKSKENLDRRIRIMEKQLKIWHHKFATQEENRSSDGKEMFKMFDVWEKEIADLDKEEENLILEMRNEEYITSQVGLLDQVVNYFFLKLMSTLNQFNMCPHLYLMDFIKSKNSEICKDIELNIYDYISQEYDEYTSLAKAIFEFYNKKEAVRLKLLQIKHEEKEKEKNKPVIELKTENKKQEDLAKAADILYKKLLNPKETIAINMTQHQSTKERKLYFDSEVHDMKIRFYNIMDTGKQDFTICHRMGILQKLIYLCRMTPSLVLDNFQGITLAAILIYCMVNPTLLKLVLLVHVILNGLTEELNLHKTFWQRTFIVIAGISCVKLLLKSIFTARSATDSHQFQIFPPHQTTFMLIEFFCGPLSLEVMEVVVFLFTVLRIMQAQLEGCFLKYTTEFENISDSYMRVGLANEAQNQQEVRQALERRLPGQDRVPAHAPAHRAGSQGKEEAQVRLRSPRQS
jgi:hypothetical protein